MAEIDPENHEQIADIFGISNALACEIMWINDEDAYRFRDETPEQRFDSVRVWIVENLKPAPQ